MDKVSFNFNNGESSNSVMDKLEKDGLNDYGGN